METAFEAYATCPQAIREWTENRQSSLIKQIK